MRVVRFVLVVVACVLVAGLTLFMTRQHWLGWVGVQAGNAIQGLAAGTRDAQAAGGKGGGMAMKAVK